MGKVGRAEVGGGTQGSGILTVAMSRIGTNNQGQVAAKSVRQFGSAMRFSVLTH